MCCKYFYKGDTDNSPWSVDAWNMMPENNRKSDTSRVLSVLKANLVYYWHTWRQRRQIFPLKIPTYIERLVWGVTLSCADRIFKNLILNHIFTESAPLGWFSHRVAMSIWMFALGCSFLGLSLALRSPTCLFTRLDRVWSNRSLQLKAPLSVCN